MEIKVHLLVSGRVQGVFYRYWAQKEAEKLALSGWVRNRSDGQVEIVLLGPEKSIKKMVKRCRQGPPLARVEAIKILSWKKVKEDPFQGKFERRETV